MVVVGRAGGLTGGWRRAEMVGGARLGVIGRARGGGSCGTE